MYAAAGPRCPVKFFREYLARRPPEKNSEGSLSRFFLAAITSPSSIVWYKKQPLGKKSLGSFMKSMSKAASLMTRHTKHSAWRTMISTLWKENVEPLNIIALAGQRNLKSLDSYSSTSIEQQKTMPAKLSNFMEDLETRKTSIEEKILKHLTASNGPQDDGAKNMLAGAVFNNCQFTVALDAHGFETGEHSNLFQRKKFKRILPLSDSDDDL